jgi:hypothetical protein
VGPDAFDNAERIAARRTAPCQFTFAARGPGVEILHHHGHASVVTHAHDFWLARGAVVVVAGLQLLLVNDFSVGPRRLAPTIELLLLVPLSIATVWVRRQVKQATTEAHFYLAGHTRRWIRRAAIGLTALITAINFIALFLLLRALLGVDIDPILTP